MSREKSQNAIDVLNRLAHIKGTKTDTDLAALLNVRQNTLSTWKQRGSFDYEKVIALCDRPNDLVYVLKGERCLEDIPSNSISIPVYSEVSAAAGHGAVNRSEQPTLYLSVPVELLSHGRAGDYKIIFVQGDSMEPTLLPREPIIIDFGVHSIIGPGIYVIRIDGELFVKRLDKLPDGSVRVSSDNNLYAPYLIQPGSGVLLDVVGKVVMNIKVI